MENLNIYTKPPLELIRGIPSFVKNDYHFKYFPQPELLHLLSLAERIGWKEAVVFLRSPLTKYLTDDRRHIFTPLLPLTSKSKILDMGAGLGSLSLEIAKRNPSSVVYAFDKTLEGLFLLNVIKEQEKLWNLHIARVDAFDIPLDDCFFDLVLMVGVLEWIGSSILGMQPMEAQKRVLQEAYRVLKSGGELLVGIENRFGYQNLRGHLDHSGLSYTSLMPRCIANLYTKIRLGCPYNTYTYSERGYRKLLAETGFTDVRFFAAFPDYRFPELILEIGSVKEGLSKKKLKLLTKLALRCMPGSLVRLLVPCYLIVAVK
jgi:SAM-dependent methyltransferase